MITTLRGVNSQSSPSSTLRPEGSQPGGLLAKTIAPEGLIGGRYRIGERVGAGGMATIFRAHDPVLERDVAVKVVHAHLAGDDALVERFRHEARHAAALDHPNVVHVYDAGVEDLPYIVMEYIDGPSLRQVLQQRGRLTPGETLTVLEPIGRALARAHVRGVIHRDVKPENILLSSDGRAKIADFGIARTMAATSQTRTGQLIGTVHYLAPELVDGRDATSRSDQYALGVVAFEMLTGRKALPADSPAAVALRHARERVPAPGEFVTDSSKQLDRVVARATARDPGDRFEDLNAFADALHAAVPGGPRPLTFTTDGDQERTLVVDQSALPTATVAAVDDVERRNPAMDDAPASRTRAARLVRASLLAVLIVAALAISAGAYWNFVVAPVQTVPSLIGLTEGAAGSELEELGLLLEVNGREFDLEAPEGAILSQDPDANAQLRSGGAVGVVVSAGLDTTDVPDVTGRTVDEAQSALSEHTLGDVTVVDEVFSDTVERGRILSQEPEAAATVDQLTPIEVVVSRGIEQVEVPELVGLDQQEAEQAIEEAKLGVDITSEYSDEVPTEGQVISQGVEPATTVDKGTTVDLVVSRGPLTITLPDVRGKPLDAAVEQLEALGLTVETDQDPVPTVGPFKRGVPGRAEETIPQAGKEITRGDDVLIYTFVDG